MKLINQYNNLSERLQELGNILNKSVEDIDFVDRMNWCNEADNIQYDLEQVLTETRKTLSFWYEKSPIK